MTFTPAGITITLAHVYVTNLKNALKKSTCGSFSAFEVVLICESEADVVAITAGVLAALRDSGTEAGGAAGLHAEVTLGTVSCPGRQKTVEQTLAASPEASFTPGLSGRDVPAFELEESVSTPSGIPNTRPLALMASQVYAPWSDSFTSRMVRVPRPFSLVMEILRAKKCSTNHE